MPKIKRPGALFVLFLILVSVILTWFFVASEDYYDYAAESIESSARLAPMDKSDVLALHTPAKQNFNSEVKYRNFFISAPGAKQVELQADFNRWGQQPIILKPYSRGYFETSVALTSGEYKYVFNVDGKDVMDPLNKDRTEFDGREVCIKTVR